MKEFGSEKIFFVCTDSTEIFFSKLRSAGLNYNLPSFFTDSYCAGVSNKHCLLTFFFCSKSTFSKNLSGISVECQTVCIQIRPDTLSGLIWVQTVCKGY